MKIIFQFFIAEENIFRLKIFNDRGVVCTLKLGQKGGRNNCASINLKNKLDQMFELKLIEYKLMLATPTSFSSKFEFLSSKKIANPPHRH